MPGSRAFVSSSVCSEKRMQARARSALLLSVVPLRSYFAQRISSLFMNVCGRTVVNGFKKD